MDAWSYAAEKWGFYRHWVEELAEEVERFLERRAREGKKEFVFNGGLSVSGLQHVGRLRGEVVIPEVVRRILERRRGWRIRQYITLYTQDAWKGKEPQCAQFPDPREACEKYTGWPLIRVPDPKGCHANWVEHYWADFGPYLGEFTDGRIEVVTTTELYRGRLLEFTRMSIERREEIRRILNKYRGRNPYPSGWIPFEPICSRCGRIDSTEALEVRGDTVVYRCRRCGYSGEAPLTEGKLNWRLEWVGVWWALGVDFEPYGKDHAMPGGSRDSAKDLAVNVFGMEPPMGTPYEWVAYRDPESGEETDMSSSDFKGFTPREWYEVAHPEVLRFLYLRVPPMRKVTLSLRDIPNYYNAWYQAERVFYGVETTGDREQDAHLAKTYLYSLLDWSNVPDSLPAQPPYTHVAILSWLLRRLPDEEAYQEALRRLQRTGHMPSSPTSFDQERLRSLMHRARRWMERYAPPQMRVDVLEEPPRIELPDWVAERMKKAAELLAGLQEWSEEAIKEALVKATEGLGARQRREFYRWFYRLFVGRDSGPRAAPLLSLLDREFVVKRLRGEA